MNNIKLNNLNYILVAGLLLVGLLSCSDDSKKKSEVKQPKASNMVPDNSLLPKQAQNALNKAKGVEATLQKEANQQRQTIDGTGDLNKKEGQQ